MSRLTFAAAAALLAACLPAVAAAQGGPQPLTLVHAGNLFDSEAGRMVGPRDILIRGERVAEVGQGLTAPDGAIEVDLSRCSVLPGLIDAHTHLLLEQRADEPLSGVAARDQAQGDVYRVLSGASRGRQYLEAGFTTVRDLGNSGRYLDLMLERGINDGLVAGPRIYGSGPGLAPAGGQLEPMAVDPHHLVDAEYRIVTSPDDARAAVREAIARGADVIKMYPEATPQRTRMSVAEMQAVVSEAGRHGIPVAAHATSDAAIREAVEAGVTSIEHGYEISDETLRLMAAKGVWLVPTDPSLEMALEFTSTWPQQPPREEIDRHLQGGRDRLMRAHRLGVRIALGSDLYFPYAPGRGAGSRATLDAYVESGLTPAEALQAATWEAGRLLGDGALGAVRADAWADLVAVEGDPTQGLAPLRSPRLVMKGGRIEAGAASACAG
ncbi:imidazolonepropionase-like amidohydrolase [Brevundimonas alba]|uniref:Imidazolonepropionase-like amidohydrolase n=1 Tax=Brevundimonas alba TaxID=74314 RepID=A0A7X5YKK4_9CAUL|nr:amidohydrolase family protein [Brevundimonas alba]NJC41384.1 imidazolonepropionase-like amidohydrolase [Brevundimonas alba]